MTLHEFCSLIPKKNFDNEMDISISICYYNKKNTELLSFFEDQLNKTKNISNPQKKKKLNNSLYLLIQKLINVEPDQDIHQLIFLRDDEYFSYNLNQTNITIAKEFNLPNPFYKNASDFLFDYFTDFFDCKDFTLYIEFAKNKSKLILCTRHKQISYIKPFRNCDEITNEIYNLKTRYFLKLIIIHGMNDYKNPEHNIIYIDKLLKNNEEIYGFLYNQEISNNLNLLQNRIYDLEKNEHTKSDLYVFGKLRKEIKESIENYFLKELFIESKKLIKLKEFIDPSLLNFKIYKIESLSSGDIGERFINDYNGIMGIRYFC